MILLTKTFPSIILKTGIVGDTNIGKTSLMVKYAEGAYDTEYIQTLGKWRIFSSFHMLSSHR